MSSRQTHWRRALGIGLVVLGVALTVGLAVLGAQHHPLTPQDAGLLAVGAAGCQLGAVFAFNGIGRPDPVHARRSIQRVYGLAVRANQTGAIAQRAFEENAPARESHVVLGQIAVSLSWIEEGLSQGLKDWLAFQPDDMKPLEGTTGNDE